MDGPRFDALLLWLVAASSRRAVVRGLTATLGLGFTWHLPPKTSAKKRKKKVKFNEFGCVSVGRFCKRANQCCSGICKGKQGKKTCRAHDSGGCQAGQRESQCGGSNAPCTTSTGNPNGICNTTTGRAGFCRGDIDCVQCAKDADCRAAFGPRAACVLCLACFGSATCAGPD